MNVFYFMHIDWGWIKQRPQFIAEGLSNYFDVCVYHERSYKFFKLCEKIVPTGHLSVKSLFHLPLMRNNVIFRVNMWLMNRIFLKKKYKTADIVWFTHPMHFSSFIHKNQILIYDCMDDILEFNYSASVKKRYFTLEERLCRKADYIITSSDYLKDKIVSRYNISNDIHVINNAISLNVQDEVELPSDVFCFFQNKERNKIITYVGTISNWFDFDLLLKTLEINTNIEFLLFGPTEVEIPKNDRIKYCGIVEHKYVVKILNLSDALMMPFVVNELIRSVNPVKAYEYIYAYKPIFMPKYTESLKFVDYIYLYDENKDFFAWTLLLAQGKLSAKKTKDDCRNFALNNNWDARIEQVLSILKEK